MKILFISNLYPPCALGGYEKLCHTIATQLSERDHEVYILTSTFQKQQYISQIQSNLAEKRIYRVLRLLVQDENNVYKPSEFNIEELKQIQNQNAKEFERVLNEVQPNIIFIWNLYFLNKELFYTIENSGYKIVYFLTDNWMREMFANKYLKKLSLMLNQTFLNKLPPLLASIVNRSVKSVGKVIYSSYFVQKLYKDCAFHFTEEKIIYNGVNLSCYLNNSRRYHITGKCKLLFAGRVVEVKGVHVLIQAIDFLVNRYKCHNITLDIVGDLSDEGYTSKIKELINAYKLNDYIHFFPPVKEECLVDLFNTHDIFIFPSLYEPFSLTLILALASGIPIIGSNAGGNIEILKNKYNSFVYPKKNSKILAKSISRLIDNDTLRKKFGINGRLNLEQYSIYYMVSQIEDYLKN